MYIYATQSFIFDLLIACVEIPKSSSQRCAFLKIDEMSLYDHNAKEPDSAFVHYRVRVRVPWCICAMTVHLGLTQARYER